MLCYVMLCVLLLCCCCATAVLLLCYGSWRKHACEGTVVSNRCLFENVLVRFSFGHSSCTVVRSWVPSVRPFSTPRWKWWTPRVAPLCQRGTNWQSSFCASLLNTRPALSLYCCQVLGTIGTPIFDTQVKVVDPESGATLPDGYRGIVRGEGAAGHEGILQGMPLPHSSLVEGYHEGTLLLLSHSVIKVRTCFHKNVNVECFVVHRCCF